MRDVERSQNLWNDRGWKKPQSKTTTPQPHVCWCHRPSEHMAVVMLDAEKIAELLKGNPNA